MHGCGSQLGASICKLAERKNDLVMWDKGIRHLAQAVYIDPLNVAAWAAASTNYMAMGYQKMAVRCFGSVQVYQRVYVYGTLYI